MNALSRAILGDEMAPAECTADGKLALSTDNQAAANALRAHARARGISIGEVLKPRIASAVRIFAALLRRVGSRPVEVRHERHEHGRPAEEDDSRQDLIVRLNRCCDMAAGAAAQWEGLDGQTGGDY